jgi:Ca-activated chloride channel family protein
LIVDTSLSMEATDVKPTRLAAAKQLSIEFAKSLPEQFNLALVSLSGNPAVRMPPTLDRSLAERAINALTPDESTAVGDAISTALSALKIAPKGDDGKPPPGAIVLLSDGQNTAGRSPMQAADNARKEKVPVYTIAYGSDNGWVDVDGKRERVPPDKEMLRSIAQLTGGRAWEAETASDLSQVYRGIRSQVGYEEVKKEVTATWAGYGLVFAVLAAMAAVSMGARWP